MRVCAGNTHHWTCVIKTKKSNMNTFFPTTSTEGQDLYHLCSSSTCIIFFKSVLLIIIRLHQYLSVLKPLNLNNKKVQIDGKCYFMKSTEATAVPNAFSFRKHCPHVDIWGTYSCTNTEPFTRNKMNINWTTTQHKHTNSVNVLRYLIGIFFHFLKIFKIKISLKAMFIAIHVVYYVHV